MEEKGKYRLNQLSADEDNVPKQEKPPKSTKTWLPALRLRPYHKHLATLKGRIIIGYT
jgi:hypothetical protein